MRVLLINYEYPPVGGGASNATWEIARAIVKLGHEPVVLTARYKHREPDVENPGIKVIQVAAIRRRKDRCSIFEMTTFVMSASLRIRKILRQEKIEGMIAFFSIPCGPIAWWGWRTTKIPYIISLRGGDVPGNERKLDFIHFLISPLRKTVLRTGAAVFANSIELGEKAKKTDLILYLLVPNGVDTNFWFPIHIAKYTAPAKFLFVGRFQQQKNLRWLIQQLAELRSYSDKPFVMEFVGGGPMFASLVEESRRLHIENQITWSPWKTKVALRTTYQNSHCLILPSNYEGMPNAALEAMACGVPILASSTAVSKNLVEHEKSGWIFRAGDGEHFIEIAQRILAYPHLVKQFGQLARSNVETRFDWGQTANEHLNVFRRIRGTA